MKTEELIEQFKALANDALPLQKNVAEITAKQVQISFQLNKALLSAAFPEAKVEEVVAIAEVKPTDLSMQARSVIEGLKEMDITPSRILCDPRRMVVTLLQ